MKAVVLLSGGIDSPVALYLISKKAENIIAVHMEVNNDKSGKIMRIKKTLESSTNKKIKLYKIRYHKIQKKFSENCNSRFLCVLCKRTMLKIAEKIALMEKADFLVTGESLSQVASQTLDNLAVNTKAVAIPIIRPLLCNDKEETIILSKKIGLFDASVSPGICCSAVPKNPATSSTQSIIVQQEKKIDIEDIIAKAVESAEIIE